MSVWPEERVRERLERGGGTLDIEVSELLAQFGARRITGRGKADADAALAEVGVRVEPPDWLDGEPAQLRLSLADLTAGGVAEPPPPPPRPARAPATPPPPPVRDEPATPAERVAIAVLYEAREAAAVAYCSRICAPIRTLEAVEAAFRAVAEAAEPDVALHELDARLLEKLRGAAARRARSVRAHGRAAGARRGTTACEQMPMVLAARASGCLSPDQSAAVDAQTQRCPGCAEAAARFREAERTYAMLCDAEPLSALRARLVPTQGGPAPAARLPAARWEGVWVQDGGGPRVGVRRRPLALPDSNGHGPGAAPPPPPAGPAPADPEPSLADLARATLERARERPWARAAGAALLLAFGFGVATLVSRAVFDDPRPARPASAADPPPAPRGSTAQRAAAHNAAARVGDPLGRLLVPRLGVRRLLVQGAAPDVVRTAAGHDPRTSLPGGTGPVAFLGHRLEVGAPMGFAGLLRGGDQLVFELPYGRFVYTVRGAGAIAPGVALDLRRLRRDDLVLGIGDPPVQSARRVLVSARLSAAGPVRRPVRPLPAARPRSPAPRGLRTPARPGSRRGTVSSAPRRTGFAPQEP